MTCPIKKDEYYCKVCHFRRHLQNIARCGYHEVQAELKAQGQRLLSYQTQNAERRLVE